MIVVQINNMDSAIVHMHSEIRILVTFKGKTTSFISAVLFFLD